MNDWFEAEQRVERAQQLAEARRWADAIVEIEAALEINPHNASWHAHHAFLLDQSGRQDESLQAYQRSLDLEPTDPDVRFAYGVALMSLGRYARAVKVFAELARQNPNDELQCFEKAEALGEHLPLINVRKGEAALHLGRFNEAREHLESACEQHPREPGVHVALGDAWLNLRRFDRALEAFRRSLALEPEAPQVHHRAAICLFKLARHEAGLRHCHQAIRLDPNYVSAMRDAAVAYLHLGQWSSVKAMARRALEVDPTAEAFRRLSSRLWLYRIRHHLRALLLLLLGKSKR